MVSLNLCPVSISSIGVHLLKDIVLINILTNSMLKVTVMSLLTVSNTVLSLFLQQNLNVICCLCQMIMSVVSLHKRIG